MKSLVNLGTGGAILVIWKSIPAPVKYMVIGGLATLGASELVIDVNHALNSPEIFHSQAGVITADAQQKQAVADAANTSVENIKARLKRGEKVTVTESMQLREYEIKENQARVEAAKAINEEIAANVNSAVYQFLGGIIKAVQEK